VKEQTEEEQLRARLEDAEAEGFVREMLQDAGLSPDRSHRTLDFWRHLALTLMMEVQTRSVRTAGNTVSATAWVQALVPVTRAERMKEMRTMLDSFVVYDYPHAADANKWVIGVRPRHAALDATPDRVNTCDMDGHP
jgi:hypothetical protein